MQSRWRQEWEAGDLVLMLLFWVSLGLNLVVLLSGLSFPNCAGGLVVTLRYCRYFLTLKYPQLIVQTIWG